MKIHSSSLLGMREKNEDVIVVKKSKINGEVIACCFDGHGGSFVSEFLGNYLIKSISNTYDNQTLIDRVETLHYRMAQRFPSQTAECGSTILVCRVDASKRRLQVLHLGDSRAVLSTKKGKVVQLTKDHSPDIPDERLRISMEGQEILWDSEDEVYRINGYSLSRAFGDAQVKGISHTPVVANFELSSDTDYIILACDGLWDVFTPKQACRFLNDMISTSTKELKNTDVTKTKANMAHCLATEALKRGSTDNVSVIVILL